VERHRGAGQLVLDVVRPGVGPVTDDAQGDLVRLVGPVPGGQDLADRRVEVPLERDPRAVEVVVHLSEGHRAHDRVQRGPVAAVDEQHPLRLVVHLAGSAEQLPRGWAGHPLVDEDHRRPAPLGGRPPEEVGGLGRGRSRHLVVAAEPAVQVTDQVGQSPGVVGDHDDPGEALHGAELPAHGLHP
jgi:hypothetical protein